MITWVHSNIARTQWTTFNVAFMIKSIRWITIHTQRDMNENLWHLSTSDRWTRMSHIVRRQQSKQCNFEIIRIHVQHNDYCLIYWQVTTWWMNVFLWNLTVRIEYALNVCVTSTSSVDINRLDKTQVARVFVLLGTMFSRRCPSLDVSYPWLRTFLHTWTHNFKLNQIEQNEQYLT
jgi:hypothetical protein